LLGRIATLCAVSEVDPREELRRSEIAVYIERTARRVQAMPNTPANRAFVSSAVIAAWNCALLQFDADAPT